MGNLFIEITAAAIDLEKAIQWAPNGTHGASCSFIGYVRNLNMGKQVTAIEYDCYEKLCENVFRKISEEAQEKWGQDSNILIIHRHGRLNIGEASVCIIVTTKHRDESYKTSRYIIEEIKERAPIWKKEFYLDGETDWVRGHALCQHRKIESHEDHRNHSCGGKVHSHESR